MLLLFQLFIDYLTILDIYFILKLFQAFLLANYFKCRLHLLHLAFFFISISITFSDLESVSTRLDLLNYFNR